MRARVGAAVALSLLVACTGGDGAGRAGRPTTSPAPVQASSSTLAATTTTAPAGAVIVDPPGSVTLSVRDLALPAGAGLRVVVRASSPVLTVRRRGGGGALSTCPVADPATPAAPGGCRPVGGPEGVQVTGGGVEIRATAAAVDVDEVTVTWLPTDRSVTLSTPARSAGACAATACQATFGLTPARAGSFSLDGRAAGGRARLILQAIPNTGSIRTLATVEGGASLSIRATLDAVSEATLLYRELSGDPVGPLVMEIFWP